MKHEKKAMEKICDLEDIDLIITDSGLSDELFEKFQKKLVQNGHLFKTKKGQALESGCRKI